MWDRFIKKVDKRAEKIRDWADETTGNLEVKDLFIRGQKGKVPIPVNTTDPNRLISQDELGIETAKEEWEQMQNELREKIKKNAEAEILDLEMIKKYNEEHGEEGKKPSRMKRGIYL